MIELPKGISIEDVPIEKRYKSVTAGLTRRIKILYEAIFKKYGDEGLELIRDTGIVWLEQEAVTVNVRGQSLTLAGVACSHDQELDAARLAQALPNIDFHMSLGIVQDVQVGTYDRWQYLAMLEGTNKPINVTAVDLDGLRDQLEMAHIRVGGKDEWRKGPAFTLYIEPVSPLSHSEEVVQKLLFATDNEIPFVYTPCPLAGATAPCTLAGTAVQALTESLFGIFLSQTRKPGAPLIIGGLMSNMDMLTTVYCYGSPEMALLSAAYTEITKWLGVPEYETAGCSDVKIFDEQAAMEAAINIATAALVGGNMIHDVGYIEYGTTSSMEMLVIADEIIRDARHIMSGIEVNERTLAREAIHRAKPGGGFLADDHTLENWRQAQWQPVLLDRTRSALESIWSETSHRMQALRDDPDCAREERARIDDDWVDRMGMPRPFKTLRMGE